MLMMKIIRLRVFYSYPRVWFLCRRVATSHRWKLSL